MGDFIRFAAGGIPQRVPDVSLRLRFVNALFHVSMRDRSEYPDDLTENGDRFERV